MAFDGLSQPFCVRLGCGHSWWDHAGLKEPGCTRLGMCECPVFLSKNGSEPGLPAALMRQWIEDHPLFIDSEGRS